MERSIASAQAEEHELAAIVELDGEPIPADLIGIEKAGSKLVVHPARAADVHGPAAPRERAARLEARERIGVRRVSLLAPFLAMAAVAVEAGRLLAFQPELDRVLAVARAKGVDLSAGRRFPAVVEDAHAFRLRVGSDPGPRDAFAVETLVAPKA